MAETRIPEREDLAWLAGLLEGEGSFQVGVNGRVRPDGTQATRIRIATRMTDEDVLRKAQDMTGMGKFYKVRRDKDYYKDHWKDAWNWEINKKNHVYALCVAVYPFMGQRRRAKIRDLIDAYREMPRRGMS